MVRAIAPARNFQSITEGVLTLTTRNVVTVPGTCSEGGHATRGFANLQFRRVPGGVEIDPHVTGICSILVEWENIPKVVEWLNGLTVI